MALGPTLSLKRTLDGRWAALTEADDRYVRGRWGGWGRDPSPCGSGGFQSWFADRTGNEWVLCHDRRAYWMRDNFAEPRGVAPAECEHAFRHLFFRNSLFATCDGKLFRNDADEWHGESVPVPVAYIAAAEPCLFVAGRRAVFRRCEH